MGAYDKKILSRIFGSVQQRGHDRIVQKRSKGFYGLVGAGRVYPIGQQDNHDAPLQIDPE
jgi:hypothetical protein